MYVYVYVQLGVNVKPCHTCSTLPGLLCGLALSIEGCSSSAGADRVNWLGRVASAGRRFRVWVVVNDLFVLLQALLFTVLCCPDQFALALLVPRSLGFGDADRP